jgi:hypothetical protein
MGVAVTTLWLLNGRNSDSEANRHGLAGHVLYLTGDSHGLLVLTQDFRLLDFSDRWLATFAIDVLGPCGGRLVERAKRLPDRYLVAGSTVRS